MKFYCVCNVCEQNSAWRMCVHGRDPCCRKFEQNRSNCACIRRKHVAMVESNKHTLWNRLKTLISICKRPEFFPAKQESQEKTSNLTEQLTEVSVLIRIVLDSSRGAFNMLRSAVMQLHFEFRRYWILSKTVCERLESFSFGSKECGNTFIYLN